MNLFTSPSFNNLLLTSSAKILTSSNFAKYTQPSSAAYQGNKDLMKTLLEDGASANNANGFNVPRSVLHSSIYSGDRMIVKEILDRGPDVNVLDGFNGNSPLMLAAKMEKNEITDLLLHADGLQNCHNEENLSHLHIACMRNQLNVVKLKKMSGGYPDLENIIALVAHTKKLMVLGFFVSKTNRETYGEFFESHSISGFNEKEFEVQYLDEIQLMKNSKINKYTSVFSIISKSQNEMSHLSQNSLLQEIINSDGFLQKFSLYGYLVNLQYKKGLIRNPWLKKCDQVIRQLSDLPVESTERIVDYLNDDDIEIIIRINELPPKVESMEGGGGYDVVTRNRQWGVLYRILTKAENGKRTKARQVRSTVFRLLYRELMELQGGECPDLDIIHESLLASSPEELVRNLMAFMSRRGTQKRLSKVQVVTRK
ncbi:hypothetical protein QAD02_000893 [Eretmocerus hayati]|uniref:Uncharacterized protein n=1 Tax=Eretmocerus hayati TaxID=131215 RepID=A0ACC2NH18_9HYME|nr:hypothetical protein QAD02_000893 [Eretmocerus hayati]